MVEFLSLKKVTAKYADEIHSAVQTVVDSGWYLQGKENEKFEKNYSSYIGVKNTIGVANGLDALYWILRGYIELGVMKEGDEVIVPANTYIASIIAISDNGLKPVLVEPSLETLQIDENKIEMLFVRDRQRGKGIGKMLMEYAISKLNVKYVDVNEDNIQGVGFYKHIGFEVFKRSDLDDHGDPFPILHMIRSN